MSEAATSELLRTADRAGITLRVEGETLRVSGPSEAALLGKQLMQRKAEVIAHLTAKCAGCSAGLILSDPEPATGCCWSGCPYRSTNRPSESNK